MVLAVFKVVVGRWSVRFLTSSAWLKIVVVASYSVSNAKGGLEDEVPCVLTAAVESVLRWYRDRWRSLTEREGWGC
jgi:hypothetical protein